MTLDSGRPLRLTICGVPFVVTWDNTTSVDDNGDEAQISTGDQQILMNSKTMGWSHQRAVLLHEVLHGIIILTSQDDRFRPKGEEAIVESLSVALVALLRENPHLVAWLTE